MLRIGVAALGSALMLRWQDSLQRYGGQVARMTEGVGGGAAWSEIQESDSGWSLSTANPTTGAYHLRLSDQGSESRIIRHVLGTAKQVAGWAFRFAVEDLPAYEGDTVYPGAATCALFLADIRDVSNVSHFSVILGTDGGILVKRGANMSGYVAGTVLGRSDPCVAPGGYHHFEIKSKIDNAVGYIEIRVNEVTVLNLTGIDTQNTANAAQAQIAIGRSGQGGASFCGFGTFDFADPFAWDDDASDAENTRVDFVGDKGCYWLPVVGDTAENDHSITGSVTAYGALNELPPDGVKYLHTASPTARTVLDVAALPDNVAEVVSMMAVMRVRKEESGSVLYRGGLISGTDETYGPDDNPNTEYAYLRPGPKTVDPQTNVPWANDAAPKLLIERTA